MSNTTEATTVRIRNSLDSLPQLQSSFTFSRRPRPPPVHIPTDMDKRVPLKPTKIHRTQSKGGLRGLFSRAKTEKSIISPVLEEAMSPSARFVITPKTFLEADAPRTMSLQTPLISNPAPPTPSTPMGPANRPSRMNLRTTSVKPAKTPTKSSPKSSKTSSKSSGRHPVRSSHTWDPPPLFQAYPQAIKHAQLSASTLSADSILRMNNHKRNNSLRDEFAQTTLNEEGQAQGNGNGKKGVRGGKHGHQMSGSISKTEWTQKIFVLVTSGYLLQYSGEGSFDRLPEKMMQLGKDSVAFASDVIPGKHWVLQVSQAMDADGTPASDSRSLLSRLAFRGADYKRTATSLLLVLNSAEEMDSWLAMVRREIEALGGKKHVSETGKPQPDNKVVQLKTQPSHRFRVQRDPGQFSHPGSPQESSFVTSFATEKDDVHAEIEDINTAANRPQSTARPSTGHRSVSNSLTSHDEQQLESLRNSTNRFSYMSSGQRTLITSQGSSPSCSPTRDAFEESPPKISVDDVKLRPNAAAINERRRSMQTVQLQTLDAQPPKIFRHSTYGGPKTKPGTPNFSVPQSSSKRYSTMKGPVTALPKTPAIANSIPNFRADALPNGVKKPNQGTVSPDRPPSALRDANFFEVATFPVVTMGKPSITQIQQIRPSMIDIPARPPRLDTPISRGPSPHPQRMSSLVPMNPVDSALLDFQFPRKFASMQTLRPEDPPATAPPSIPLPPPPIASPHASATAKMKSEQMSTNVESRKEAVSPLPVLANTKTKVRKPPFSMQVQPTRSPNNKIVETPKSKPLPEPGSLSPSPQIKSIGPISMQTQSSPHSSTEPKNSKPFQTPQTSDGIRRTSMQFPLSSRASIELGNPQPSPPPTAPLPRVPTAGRSSSLTLPTSNGALSPSSIPFIMTSKPSSPPSSSRPSFEPKTSKATQLPTSPPPHSPPVEKPSHLSPLAPIFTMATPSPSVQKLKEQTKKSLINRRSIPLLLNGPPPAPPPDCALPPLPPFEPSHGHEIREPVHTKA